MDFKKIGLLTVLEEFSYDLVKLKDYIIDETGIEKLDELTDRIDKIRWAWEKENG